MLTPATVANPSKHVPSRTWMANYFLGASEAALLADRAHFLTLAGGSLAFRHVDGTTVWPAGTYQCPTVASLREQVESSTSHPATRAASDVPLTVADGIDIGQLQARLTTEQRALVQVASNFNALEVPSRDAAPDYGSLVTNYAVDSTQGPAASFGVPAASILRAHYPFFRADASGASAADTWGQTAERQIELLADVRDHFGTCVNGKSTIRGNEPPIVADGAASVAAVADRIRVGLHTDAQVIFGRGPSRDTLAVLPPASRPLVDQVLSASINLRDPLGGSAHPQSELLVKACLRAAYRGAYLSAIVRGRRLLLLTLVGGGVFGTPERFIFEAIADAHKEWAPRSQLEEVRLCLYEKGSADRARPILNALLDDGRRGGGGGGDGHGGASGEASVASLV